ARSAGTPGHRAAARAWGQRARARSRAPPAGIESCTEARTPREGLACAIDGLYPPRCSEPGRRRAADGAGPRGPEQWAPGCAGGAGGGARAAPPVLPPRPLDRSLAPRVGDTWTYQYSSAFRAVGPRLLEVRVVDVSQEAVRDRLASVGEAGGDERAFTSVLQMGGGPPGGQVGYDFLPPFPALGAVPAAGAVAGAPPDLGH